LLYCGSQSCIGERIVSR